MTHILGHTLLLSCNYMTHTHIPMIILWISNVNYRNRNEIISTEDTTYESWNYRNRVMWTNLQQFGGINMLSAVIASLKGSWNISVTKRSLSFIRTGNFSISGDRNKNNEQAMNLIKQSSINTEMFWKSYTSRIWWLSIPKLQLLHSLLLPKF